MKTSMEKLENSRVRLTVDLDGEILEKALEEAYRTTGKKISIPGFRKGRAPRKIIELNYGAGVFLEEAVDLLLPRAYEHAVKESGIRPVDQPDAEIKHVRLGEGAAFLFEVDVYPQVSLGSYRGLKAEREIVEISEEDVTDVLKKQQEQSAELVVVDSRREVQKGDFAIFDFRGYIDGQAFPGGAGENQTLEIGAGQFIPGFEEQMIGAKVGETKEIEVTFPEEYQSRELAGKKATFQVTVKELKEKSLPEIDDEFAKDISEYETLAELKEEIRKNLEDEATRRTEAELENRLLELIAADSEVVVPESMVKHQTEHLLTRILGEAQRQGINEETYLQLTGKTKEDLQKELEPQALTQIVHDLILESVAEKEGITATEEEVEKEIEQYLNFDSQLDPALEKNMREYWESQKDSIKLSLQRKKTAEFLKAEAEIVEIVAANTGEE
ncbi:MAG: trigger factor [Firmicutes bacterium]|nr:trigger factor [Bacillota bacterium]